MKISIELDQGDIDRTLQMFRKAGRTEQGRTMIIEQKAGKKKATKAKVKP